MQPLVECQTPPSMNGTHGRAARAAASQTDSRLRGRIGGRVPSAGIVLVAAAAAHTFHQALSNLFGTLRRRPVWVAHVLPLIIDDGRPSRSAACMVHRRGALGRRRAAMVLQ